eukprot:evm.model.scf_1301EXC.5 EVM.evm.TU.scf_1301EXC.5   scf_1301EXC:36205-38209(+)
MDHHPDGQQQESSDEVNSTLLAVVMFVFLAGAAMVLISVITIMSGLAVAAAWPNPSFCGCFRPFSDGCGRNRQCCHLYQANMLMALVWLVMHIFILFTQIWQLVVLAFTLALLHCTASLVLYRKFESHGWPQPARPIAIQMSSTQPEGPAARPASVPFLTAYVVGSPVEYRPPAARESGLVVDQVTDSLAPTNTPQPTAPCPA